VSSGGRGSYYSSKDLDELKELAVERLERSRNEQEITSLITQALAAINDRDVETVNARLDAIRDALSDDVEEFERLRFGGSVAKHTWVDGLSDIDSLVMLRRQAGDGSPQAALAELKRVLEARLGRTDVEEIRVGRLAVTVRYRDDDEIQLLPAIRSGDHVRISDSSGTGWSSGIDPSVFAQALTNTNQQQGRLVVPTVKLAKAVLVNTLGDNAPSGYHVEALAVAAFRNYNGSRNYRDMLAHLFHSAADGVRRPTRDITGQSVNVDENLGPAESGARITLSRRLAALAKTVESARSASEWRQLLE
jgi:hypothetical protein